MGELLNLVGLSTGVVLYAMLLAMVVRGSRTPGVQSRFDSLLMATSILGLVWNLCALPAYELPRVGIQGPFPVLVALGFSALGFLPAVVVHSVLRGERKAIQGPARRSVVTAAYAVSLLAGVLHAHAALTGSALPSGLAMRLLTYTFVALVVPLAALTRRQPGFRRAVWAAALAAFAVSALHLSQLHPDRALETLLRLTSLLRGVLRSEGEFATLGRELDIVESYLEIEQARFEERLRIRIDVPQGLRSIRVPALLLQPIVENAVKHGVAPLQQGGDVTIRGTLERAADGSLELSLTVADTGSGVTEADLRRGRALGVGLSNVERRLQGQCGTAASLSIQSVPGTGTTVTIRLPAESSRTADQPVRSVV